MPVNKNADYRYRILDRCFSNFHRKYTFDDLLDTVNEHLADDGHKGISVRQLRDDLNAIRKMLPDGVYLDAKSFDDKKCYYRYSERGISIYQNELSVQEVQELRSTIDMLSRYRGIPGHAWLEEVISNLEYRFGVKGKAENIGPFTISRIEAWSLFPSCILIMSSSIVIVGSCLVLMTRRTR